ncbi:MAG: hypothetical protein ACI9GM_000983 [Salibacteraceae bacterium]|jgi:hypothetical protein
MRILLSILFLFPVLSWAQIQDNFKVYQITDSSRMKFGFQSNISNNSTALTATVLNTAFYGGKIDTEQKNAMINRAREINTTGSIWNSSIFFAKKIERLRGVKQTQLSYFIRIADRQENLAIFNDKALQLVLNGNTQFAGQTASLDPLAFNQFQYKQLQLGFSKNFESGNGISVGASFLYGQSNRSGSTDRLDLLISGYGDRISADAEFDIYETDPNNNGFLSYNGAGASIDIQGRFNIQLVSDSSNPGIFHFSVTDFGFINWHASSTHTKVDTFYSYTGAYIENVFDQNSQAGGDPTAIWDSLSAQQNASFTLFTPTTLHFYLVQTYKKLEYTIGGAHRSKAYFHPYFYGKAGYQITPKLQLSGQLNYGGYGYFGGGFEIVHESNRHQLKLGSTNLEGFIAPKKWGGQSIYLQLTVKL